jgi:integrase
MVPDGDGLYLTVTAAGVASWIYRYRAGGRERYMGLGPLRHVNLSVARQLADEARQLRRAGIDPLEQRRTKRLDEAVAAARTVTFKKCAQDYIAAHRAGWRSPIHVAQWKATLETYVFPVFGDLPVQAIDTGLVLKAIWPIWAEKTETASRVRGRVEAVLDWAATHGYRSGDNPARWKGHLENVLPKKTAVRRVAHHAALPYGEIGAFLAELRRRPGIAARALEFVILTGVRSGEAMGARWSEITDRVWTIPAERMKGHREHRVPLSDAALRVVEAMAAVRSGEFIFPGVRSRQPLSRPALFEVLRRMGRHDLTTHGFRSTLTDWAADRGFPREVREQVLAHALGSQVEKAYRRSDLFTRRQQMMQAWAAYCSSPASPAEVVPLRPAG